MRAAACLSCLVSLACTPEKGPVGSPEDADGDGWIASEDCADESSAIHPGADERCDGIDGDCDGRVDNDPVDGDPWYPDADGDGYGGEAGVVLACEPVDGFLEVGGDCDDDDPAVSPASSEACNERDDDCDGWVDEGEGDLLETYTDADGDGYGDESRPLPGCEVGPGTSTVTGDCDDADAVVHPGAMEICDGLDTDCDPATEEGEGVAWIDGAGAITDLSEVLAAGAPDAPVRVAVSSGTLVFCPGTWSVNFTVQGSARFQGSGLGSTVLDGGFTSSVFTVVADDAEVVIEDLTIQGGRGTALEPGAEPVGGGLVCVGDAALSLQEVMVFWNAAPLGGGMYVDGCAVSLEGVSMYYNDANHGGGILAYSGSIALTDSVVHGNLAYEGGGGVLLWDQGEALSLTLTDTLVRQNLADYGAGLALVGEASAACAGYSAIEAGFFQNEAARSGGGVALVATEGSPRFDAMDCDFGEEPNQPDDVSFEASGRVVAYEALGMDADLSCVDGHCE